MCDKCDKVYKCILNDHRDCFNRILETQDNPTLIENNYISDALYDEIDEYDDEDKLDDILRHCCKCAIDLGLTWFLDRIEEEFGYYYISGLFDSCSKNNMDSLKYYMERYSRHPDSHFLIQNANLYRAAVGCGSVEIIEYLRTCPMVPVDKTIIQCAIRNGHQEILEYLLTHNFPYSSNLPKLAARYKQIRTFWYLVDELELPFKNDQTTKLLDPCINDHNLSFPPLRHWLISQYHDLVERDQTHLCPNIEKSLSERIKLETLIKEILYDSNKVANDILEYIVFFYL